MKVKKIFLFMIVISITLLTLNVPIYASSTDTIDEEYLIKNRGPIEEIEKNSRNLELIEEGYSQIPMPAAYSPHKLNVTAYRQETSYWCGPANIKQVIQFINGSSDSQSTYANSMQTNSSDGTYVYKMVNELNKRQSKFTYAYKEVTSSVTASNIDTYIHLAVAQQKPMILHAKTQPLYLYNGANLGHYLTISGFSDDILGPFPDDYRGPNKAYYTDPYYKDYGRGSVFGTHLTENTTIYNCVKNRFIII